VKKMKLGQAESSNSAAPATVPHRPDEVDGATKDKLIDELERRDRNIVVLRDLLKVKKDKLEGAASPSASPAKIPDYKTMPMSRLLALDKARDATVTYILKQLDKVDQQQREEDELDAAFEQVAEQEERKKDEQAFSEMEKITAEEEDEEAFAVMEQIAREMEEEASSKEASRDSNNQESPRTPKRVG
jgi:hypothetical protein